MTTDNYDHVLKFMQTFGQDTPDKITIPSTEVRKLRAKLILEEALETIEAMGVAVSANLQNIKYLHLDFVAGGSVKLASVLDGLIDLDVVARQGTGIAFGFSKQLLAEASDEVSRSNMSKLWTAEEVKTPDSYPHDYTTEQVSGCHPMYTKIRCWLVRNADGKVIKSPSYSPANLQPLIDKDKS